MAEKGKEGRSRRIKGKRCVASSDISRKEIGDDRRLRLWIVVFLCGAMGLGFCSCATPGYKTGTTARSYSQYLKGLLNDRIGSVDEAVASYQRTQVLDKRAPEPHLQLALDYIRLKKFNEAVSELEKVIRLTPDDEYAHYVLALLYVQFNDFGKAAGQYEKLLEKNLSDRAENTQLRHILSQLYFLEKDYPDAQRHCAELLRADPLDEGGLYISAMIAGEENQIERAIAGFQEIINNYPDNDDAMNALAYLYAEQERDLDKALPLAEKAVENDPSNGAYLDTLGWVYFKLGETDKALGFLERASKLMIDPVILNHLGEVYYKKGMLKEAKERWALSLKLDPNQQDIRQRQKNL